MKATEARKIAKEILIESLSVAYYRLEDTDYSEEEVEKISKYIDQYGERMAKSIGEEYFTR